MGPIQISVAIIMVGVAFAGIVWIYMSQTSASARRMAGMMKRVGLDPEIAMLEDPRPMTIRFGPGFKEARRRCRRCPREDLCERWLAGEVKEGNSFCPNAQTFRNLTGATARTS